MISGLCRSRRLTILGRRHDLSGFLLCLNDLFGCSFQLLRSLHKSQLASNGVWKVFGVSLINKSKDFFDFLKP